MAVRVDFVIDGSNVLLANRNRLGGVPSVRVFAGLLSMLDANDQMFRVWFDDSIYPEMERLGGDIQELKQLIAELNSHRLLSMTSRADAGIQENCQRFNAGVINGGDNCDSWPVPRPPIFRCWLEVALGGELLVYVVPRRGRQKIFTQSISKPFHFRGIQYAAFNGADLSPDPVIPWARPPRFKGRIRSGTLLVLALDASPSMDETDTHDGQSRAAHVNEILRLTIDGLSGSSIASSLQIAILSFSSDVVLQSPNGSGFVFSRLQEWQDAPLNNYLCGVSRDWTNIRLALDRAVDYIDGFRRSDVAQQIATKWDKAAVVMLTDGAHEIDIGSGVERSKDIINHVFTTITRSENTCFGFVGLGDGADHESLTGWASEATSHQIEMARKKNVRLVNRRLYVRVDTGDSDLNNIVRSFIDVASQPSMGRGGQRA